MVTLAPAQFSVTRLFFVTDHTSGVRYLVDTGAEVSVVPPLSMDRTQLQSGLVLCAANDSCISTFGTRSFTLDLGPRQKFPWVFIVAEVKRSILGVDFLGYYNLLVDVTQQRLVHSSTQTLI